MTWTYVQPITTDRDRVRFLVGDTDALSQLMSDEEINYVITLFPTDIYMAASYVASRIAGSYASKRDKTVGRLSISYGSSWERYRDLAKSLLDMSNNGPSGRQGGIPVLGGGGPTYLGKDWSTNTTDFK